MVSNNCSGTCPPNDTFVFPNQRSNFSVSALKTCEPYCSNSARHKTHSLACVSSFAPSDFFLLYVVCGKCNQLSTVLTGRFASELIDSIASNESPRRINATRCSGVLHLSFFPETDKSHSKSEGCSTACCGADGDFLGFLRIIISVIVQPFCYKDTANLLQIT